jgi:hypothetical protein
VATPVATAGQSAAVPGGAGATGPDLAAAAAGANSAPDAAGFTKVRDAGGESTWFWQSQSGQLCLADAGPQKVDVIRCVAASPVPEGSAPRLHVFNGPGVDVDGKGWNLAFLADDETVDRLACGDSALSLIRVRDARIGSVQRTFYVATSPNRPGGVLHASVTRQGAAATDVLTLAGSGTGGTCS